MSSQRYQIKVVGEGRPRVKGVLAFVAAQALDLISRSTYVVSISEATPVPAGVMRLHSTPDGVIGVWQANPNHIHPQAGPPSWCNTVINMSVELGKKITWQQQT